MNPWNFWCIITFTLNTFVDTFHYSNCGQLMEYRCFSIPMKCIHYKKWATVPGFLQGLQQTRHMRGAVSNYCHLQCLLNSFFFRPTRLNINIPRYCTLDEGNLPMAGSFRLPLLWRHNGCYSVSNHQPHDCFLNRLFSRISKKTSKLRDTGTGEFPAQRASNAENVSIWWRHHEFRRLSREITISLHNVIWRRARRTPCQMFGSMKSDFWKAVYYQGHFLWIWGPMDSRMDPIVSGSE